MPESNQFSAEGIVQPSPRLSCNRCGHSWVPKGDELPKSYPNRKCRSPLWNKERRKKGTLTNTPEYRRKLHQRQKNDPVYIERRRLDSERYRKAHPDRIRAQNRRRAAHIAEWIKNNKRELGKTMDLNKTCSLYLGVHIAERALAKAFKNVMRLPNGTPGGDFICGKGYLVDCKSSCVGNINTYPRWNFVIRRNTIADYFLLLAFNSRADLTPLHIWLVPGEVINYKMGLTISNSQIGLNKWLQYERPIDKIVECCNEMKIQAPEKGGA
jgi:hypothetical protein